MALLMPVSIYAGVTESGERNAPASLAASRAAAYDAGTYRLASGDMIRIQVFGEDDLSLEVRLDSSGVINYPFLGKIRVKGLTVEALRNRLIRGLKDGYLRSPQVNVSIVEHRSFFIVGEVKNPGAYPYQPGLTVRRAISLAGGFTEFATRDHFSLVHDKARGKQAVAVGADALVGPGDSISVGKSIFYINGEVKNAGSYPYHPGLTLREAIALAGGFTKFATRDHFSLVHNKARGKQAVTVDADALVGPGDSISVGKSIFYINGEVKNAGSYPYHPGLTLREAISLAGGLTERASESNIQIVSSDGTEHEPGRAGMGAKITSGDTIHIKQSFF